MQTHSEQISLVKSVNINQAPSNQMHHAIITFSLHTSFTIQYNMKGE